MDKKGTDGPALVWFRHDLRLEDNPALHAARGPVVPVYLWSPGEEGPWAPGSAGRVWLHGSLRALDGVLRERGLRLVIRTGEALEALRELIRETGATAVYWNRRHEPAVVRRDREVQSALRAEGVTAESFNGGLLFEPGEVMSKRGDPYKVFTPFYKACRALPEPAEPFPAPRKLEPPGKWCKSAPLGELGLEPEIDWAGGIRETWRPGEAGAREQLQRFLAGGLADYAEERDRPDREGTSRLSPHLHFGEISPRMVWHAVKGAASRKRSRGKGAETYLKELCWREFAHHLLCHFPHTTDEPLREEFARFPWKEGGAGLRAWQRGWTGYPLVDAGMRQLWATGWMHNRVRMAAASFLVKDLLLPWQEGARWFWDTLVDADLASNTLNWQWAGGCGADAAPFFRIFNPVSQSEKFDPDGAYIRRWVSELARLPAPWVHKPWEAPAEELRKAGVELGKTYPEPIVDHAWAREEALKAFRSIAGETGG
jgi:deoxyribodipyrimidine photo-lyase